MVLHAAVQLAAIAPDIAHLVADGVGPGGEQVNVFRRRRVVDLAALGQRHEHNTAGFVGLDEGRTYF